MEKAGREHLREVLKKNGDADIVEAILRTGFHKPPFLTVHHLHMHILYPVSGVSFVHILKYCTDAELCFGLLVMLDVLSRFFFFFLSAFCS